MYVQVNDRKDGNTSGTLPYSTYLTRLSRTASLINVPNNTEVAISWASEDEDGLNCFLIGSPTVCTFTRAAYIHVDVYMIWDAVTTNDRALVIRQNGTVVAGETCKANISTNPFNACAADLKVAIGDTVDFIMWQDSGGPLNPSEKFLATLTGYYFP